MDDSSLTLTEQEIEFARLGRQLDLIYLAIQDALESRTEVSIGSLVDAVQAEYESRQFAVPHLPTDDDEPWTDIGLVRELFLEQTRGMTEIADVLNCHPETVRLWTYRTMSHLHRLPLRRDEGDYVISPRQFESPVRFAQDEFGSHPFVQATETSLRIVSDDGSSDRNSISLETILGFEPHATVFSQAAHHDNIGIELAAYGIHDALVEHFGGLEDDPPTISDSESGWHLVPSSVSLPGAETPRQRAAVGATEASLVRSLQRMPDD